MKSVIRAFIAIDLSSETQLKLEQVSAHLRESLKDIPIRWVQVENIHLTLKFLGDVSLSNLEVLQKMLNSEVAGHVPFEISVGELGAFPNPRQPRVIWIGVEGPSELKAVQYGIETQMERLGYAREERPFSPHLTLGRVSRNISSQDLRRIGELLDVYKVGFLGATQVKTINLYKSDLRPGGAVYTCLFSAPLSTPS
jgi:2'-5' RNA ligase